MKYCVPYMTQTKMHETADELIIYYSDALDPEKLSKFKNKSLILNVAGSRLEDPQDEIKIQYLLQKYANMRIRIRVDKPLKRETLEKYKGRFFANLIARDWDTFTYLNKFNPTDIYVGGNLAFDLKEVASVAAYTGTAIRVYPCIADNSYFSLLYPMSDDAEVTDFFIRPEDTPIYDKYIQTIEFPELGKRTEALYNIYKSGHSSPNLKNIIIGLNQDIYNKHLPRTFGFYRINCRKKCQQDKCGLCKIAANMSVLEYQKEKEKNNG